METNEVGARSEVFPSHYTYIHGRTLDDRSGQVFFLGQWYLRPEYTVHPVARRFYKQEVFRADRVTEHLVSEVQGKCYVYFIKDFMRGRPPGFKPADEKDVFLCESRYIEKGRRGR